MGLITQPKLRKHENQPETQQGNKPIITMAIQEMERIGNPLSIQAILHANDRSQTKIHMHIPCMPKLVKEHTCNLVPTRKSDVATNPDALLHFPALHFPSYDKNSSMPHLPRLLQENSKSPTV